MIAQRVDEGHGVGLVALREFYEGFVVVGEFTLDAQRLAPPPPLCLTSLLAALPIVPDDRSTPAARPGALVA